ncbi:hypothetical protein A2U01_0040645, partial [Trifolium medium]|nr:hypothetical protein [Trifolium medium]
APTLPLASDEGSPVLHFQQFLLFLPFLLVVWLSLDRGLRHHIVVVIIVLSVMVGGTEYVVSPVYINASFCPNPTPPPPPPG